MKYIRDSFPKFKKDVLSKIICDVVKYVFLAFIFVAFLNYTPFVKEKLELEVSLTIFTILMILLLLIGICIPFSFLVFDKNSSR